MCRIAVFVLASSFLVNAQESGKEEKIDRILKVTAADAIVEQIVEQLKAETSAQLPQGATAEQTAKFAEFQSKILDAVRARLSWEKTRVHYVKLYSDTFTEGEIDGMLAFYESDAGKAMLQKMPVLMSKSMALAQKQLADIMPELERISREAMAK